MSIASVEYGSISLGGNAGVSIHGPCVFQESLDVSGEEVSGTALTADQVGAAGNMPMVARITTDDTAVYAAVGSTPDATATAKTRFTSARRLVPAGGSIDLPIVVGEKVAAVAV